MLSLSVIVKTTPESLALCVVSESSKLLSMARFIGIIALRVGIKIPIRRACIEADSPGKIDGLNPTSEEKRKAQIAQMQGTERANPSIIDGMTNMAA